MILAVSGMLEAGTKIQFIRPLVRKEALLQFESLSDDIKSTQTLNVDENIKGLAQYFYPLILPSKQKCAMRRGMKNHAR